MSLMPPSRPAVQPRNHLLSKGITRRTFYFFRHIFYASLASPFHLFPSLSSFTSISSLFSIFLFFSFLPKYFYIFLASLYHSFLLLFSFTSIVASFSLFLISTSPLLSLIIFFLSWYLLLLLSCHSFPFSSFLRLPCFLLFSLPSCYLVYFYFLTIFHFSNFYVYLASPFPFFLLLNQSSHQFSFP